MPVLNWIGKEKVINHHLEVPYHVLNKKYYFDSNGVGDGDSENMIIHGDNLLALKSLLPRFEGRIKCIYIDPPYNTGNEGWVYNDNVNDPRIREWLGKVVEKEGEDMSRHDKWLCMMYPRLKVLHRLLAEDGVIFISIDDNEVFHLKLICDEIFGSNCYVSNVSWQRTYSMRNDSKGIANEVEHILVYSKNTNWQPEKLERTEEMDSKYKNIDNDPKGKWRNIVATAPDSVSHQGMVYAIQNPFTGEMNYPPSGRHWALQQNQMLKFMNEWCEYKLEDIKDYGQRASVCNLSEEEVRRDVCAIVLVNDIESSRKQAEKRLTDGAWPEFFYTKNGKGVLSRKAYLEKVGGRPVTNFWSFAETGHTDEASRLLKQIFDNKATFDTPKPPRLIERVLQIISGNDFYVLDAFAGSGTTAHAVMNQNQKDGGKRRFILVEMADFAESVTAERVKRVISGYGVGAQAVAGIDGESFDYYELGEELLINGFINESIDIDKIREYICYSEVKCRPMSKKDEEALLGIFYDTAYYFHYQKESITVLNRVFLHQIRTKADSYVIYADLCTLSDSELAKYNITFKKIPRDITKF